MLKIKSKIIDYFSILSFILLIITVFAVNDTSADQLFQQSARYSVISNPSDVKAADLNNDGATDLVSLSMNINRISILLGDGNGSFSLASTLTIKYKGVSLALDDFNRDGKADIVYASTDLGGFSVLFNDGSGRFSSEMSLPAGKDPQWVSAGDLNEDGYPDIVGVDRHDDVIVLLNIYGSSFSEPSYFSIGIKPISGVLSDLNDDGSLDLAIVENPQYTVSVLLGDGHGSFGAAGSYDCGNDPENIIALDVTRDGITDLIVNNHQSNTITVLPGLGNGSFRAGISYDAGSGPGMVTGDFNGDCLMDLVVVNHDSGQLMILPGTASGTFDPPITQPVITKLRFIITGDFNSDLRPDLAAANTTENALYAFQGISQSACGNSFIRRTTDPESLKDAPIHASTDQTPFDDLSGSLNDGASYYYSVEHEAGLPLKLSVHKNSYTQTVRLGFNDGNPMSAPVDPSLSPVSVDRASVPADEISTATVTIVPLDSHGTRIGSGCLPVIDANLLAPAIIVGAIQDNSNGSYSFKVSSSMPGTARVSATVEGIALSAQPVINFTP